jgi:MFS transporter, FHS family, Na+ dependent glucose transporter 1
MTSIRTTDQKQQLRWKQTIAYFAAFIALGLTYAPLGPTLTNLAENTSVALDQISIIFSARGFGYLIGSVVGGRLYDSVSGNPIIIGTMTFAAVMLALIPLVSQLWLLVIVIFLLGAFQGVLDVGGNTLLVWVHGRDVSPFMNAMHFFFGVGAFLCPIIVAQVLSRSGQVHWAFWTLSLLVLPVILAMLGLPSPKAPKRGVAYENTQSGRDNTSEIRKAQNHQFVLPLIVLFFFMYVGAESGTSGWIATYAKATALGNAAFAAYLTSAFWIAITVGRLLSIPLAAHMTPKGVLFIDLLGAIASIGLPALWPQSNLAVWAGTIGVGLFMASMFPTMISFAERRLTVTGKVTSWYFVGGSLGGMTLPWLIGQLFESFGPRIMIYGIGATLVLAFAVFGLLSATVRPDKRQSQPETSAL